MELPNQLNDIIDRHEPSADWRKLTDHEKLQQTCDRMNAQNDTIKRNFDCPQCKNKGGWYKIAKVNYTKLDGTSMEIEDIVFQPCECLANAQKNKIKKNYKKL